MFRAASRPGRAWSSSSKKSFQRAPLTTNISKVVSVLPLYRRKFPFSLKISSAQMLMKTADCILQMESSLPRKKKNALVQKFLRDSEAQRQKNERYYQNRRDFCQSSIHHLTQQIKNAMLVYPQPLKIPSRSGKIFPRGSLESSMAG